MMPWTDDQGIALQLFEGEDGAWDIVVVALTSDTQPVALRSVDAQPTRSADERGCSILWTITGKHQKI